MLLNFYRGGRIFRIYKRDTMHTPVGLNKDLLDAPHEECGVVGAYLPGSPDSAAARLVFFALFALQHRGQESAGIAVGDNTTLRNFANMGLVSNVFREEDLDRLPGHIVVGHTRYSTMGSSNLKNVQPIVSRSPSLELALAHNGNVINAPELRQKLAEDFSVSCQGSSDSEVIAHLLSWTPAMSWPERVDSLHRSLKGAYSLTIATKDQLVAIRDPLGVRPLCLGRYGNGWVVASESSALDHVGAQFLREVEPGEAIVFDQKGLTSIPYSRKDSRTAHCVFEQIYFARPDSILEGKLAHISRERMGEALALDFPVEADIVIPVPDSANSAAAGYARAAKLPLEFGLIKNRYVGRTFIQPDQHFRELGVRNKFNPIPEVLADQRVVVVDDSIVRGTTTPHVISLLRDAGAREIHMRVCAPPIVNPCHFGVDMANKGEFIATGNTLEEIRRIIGADTLAYLSVERLHLAVGSDRNGSGYCDACFTGRYPIPVQLQLDKFTLERPENSYFD